MILNVKSCDYEEHGISALNYDLIDGDKGKITTGKQFCEGSYNKEVAASVIDILSKEETVSKIILSSEEFEFQRDKIFKIINRSPKFEITVNGDIKRK